MPAAQHLRAFVLPDLDVLQVSFHLRRVNCRAHVHAFVEAIANLQLFRAHDQLIHELLVHALLHDDAAGRGAALSGGAKRAPQRAVESEVQVSVVEHDHRVLATQLQRAMLERLRRFLSNGTADRCRTGQRNCAYLRMLDHWGANFAAESGDDVHHAWWNTGLMQRLHKVEYRERRVLCGLDNGGVAGDQRGEQLPGRNRHGEVPRCDHGADAQRLTDRHRELVGQLRGDGRSEQTAALAGGVVTTIDGLLHVAARFLDDLPHLAGHVARVLFFARDQQLSRLVKHLAAARRRYQTPLLEGLARGLDRLVNILFAGFLEDADHLAGVGGIKILKGAAGAAFDPLTSDKVLEDFRLHTPIDTGGCLFHGCHRIALHDVL